MEAFEDVLVGPVLPFSATEGETVRGHVHAAVSSISSDFESEGYEARITANMTRTGVSWQLFLHRFGAVETCDRANRWYGLKPDGACASPERRDAKRSGDYIIDPSAYEANGTIAKWLELAP